MDFATSQHKDKYIQTFTKGSVDLYIGKKSNDFVCHSFSYESVMKTEPMQTIRVSLCLRITGDKITNTTHIQ
jgi:hypothetical protein